METAIDNNVTAGYGDNTQGSIPQQGSEQNYTLLDLIGPEFSGTKAASFNSLEDLAKSYNNLVSLMGERVEKLTPEQRSELINSIGMKDSLVAAERNIPKLATDYRINADDPDLVKAMQVAAHAMGLSQEQATNMTELVSNVGESVLQDVEGSLQSTALDYVEQSRQAFGAYLEEVISSSEYVAENIIPRICGMDGESFLYLLGQHGLAGHPAILALLNHVGDLYAHGRGSITSGVPAGTYAAGSSNLSFFETPEAQKILANKSHPRYNEYYQALMDTASRGRR